jgi:hypothetical protein
MGGILAGIPGLIAELAENALDGDKLTHMRLILSASELALLPFELATAPNGFPGSGQAYCFNRNFRCALRVRYAGSTVKSCPGWANSLGFSLWQRPRRGLALFRWSRTC